MALSRNGVAEFLVKKEVSDDEEDNDDEGGKEDALVYLSVSNWAAYLGTEDDLSVLFSSGQ